MKRKIKHKKRNLIKITEATEKKSKEDIAFHFQSKMTAVSSLVEMSNNPQEKQTLLSK